MKLIDLTGKKFERWTVLKRVDNDKQGCLMWECICICGIKKNIRGYALKNGTSKSCGCLFSELKSEEAKTHGMTNTYIYKIWVSMIQRCTNEKRKDYHNYGGRGVKVCEEWLTFENFYKDMGDRPTEKHSLDRIEVDGDYCKNNCKWSTKEEQAANKRPLGLTKKNKSGHKGVYQHTQTGKWVAECRMNGKTKYIGSFNEKDTAIAERERFLKENNLH